MAVVKEFTLPDLGEGLTEATVVRWLVAVGDVVAIDQPVVEVETAKAMVEVPCPYGGVVTARYGEEGAELPVGAALLTVAVGEGAPSPGQPAPSSGDPAPSSGGSGNVLVGYGTQSPAPRRPRVRPSHFAPSGGGPTVTGGPAGGRPAADGPTTGRPAAGGPMPGRPAHNGPTPGAGSAVGPAATGPAADGPGANGRAVADHDATGQGVTGRAATGPATTGHTAAGHPAPDHAATAHGAPAPGADQRGPTISAGAAPAVISPLVRRLARERGIDLAGVRGSGPEGLILRADVEAAARPVKPVAEGERVPLRGLRGAVADKLSRSRREIPDATCWVDADATELLAARRAMNDSGREKVSLLALLARICTAALAEFPELNATVDLEAREIVRLPGVHLGFAAQTERGLVVPVVRDAHTRNTAALSAEIARLTEAARTGRLTPAELTGGTFTLNNYGVFGVDGSTPIINHPEAAMLGVGRIVPKPWVHQGELAVRQVVQLSLTFDHRVCDGGTAGGFLRFVADCVERPAVLLRAL
ncbi:2-oxo acid dehydrogenase subunit E2 [Streptomyces orinoci]|uniref:Dihydrolipoamide acetyltransferase component of pyruvate dehydrogenase complex n=1 Tax=Streptomyces orinoci TaxID=67339 RepID=A0ABV3K3U8_STRON|nr:dihydrolipoamide acetyltransferase family protein [Streptomyces orinoci]